MRFTIGKKVQFGNTEGEVLRIFAEQKIVEILKKDTFANNYVIALWPMRYCSDVDSTPTGVHIPAQLRARVNINRVIAGLDKGTITLKDAIETLKEVREYIKNDS